VAVRQGSMEDLVGRRDFGFPGDRWWRNRVEYRPEIEACVFRRISASDRKRT